MRPLTGSARRGVIGLGTVTVAAALGAAGTGLTHAGQAGAAPPGTPTVTAIRQGARSEIADLLANVAANGFNAASGGLAINWRYGTKPLQINFNGSGRPDVSPTQRHDPLTDLRFLEDLLHYRAQHPSDIRFNTAITRFTPIVKAELTRSVNPRGWVYFDLIQLAAETSDPFYARTADRYAAAYQTIPADPQRRDWNIERAAALIDHGRGAQNPAQLAAGHVQLMVAMRTAYDPRYHVLVVRRQVRSGEAGQEAEALAAAGQTRTAREILAGTTALLWDGRYGGYYARADVPAGGTPTVRTAAKEPGDQAEMLLAAYKAEDTALEQRILPIVTGGAYYRPGHGVLQESRPDWTPVRHVAGTGDWVTSEAMASTVDALLALDDKAGARHSPGAKDERDPRWARTAGHAPCDPDGSVTATPERCSQ